MVKAAGILAALIAIGFPTAVSASCTKGSEFSPPLCSLKLPAIVSVTIEENAARSPLESDSSIDCSGFVLTRHLVRRYLTQAKQVPDGSGHSTLDWSACYAKGTLTFRNGQTASWSVTGSRVGSLTFDGQTERVLYCPNCTYKPFAPG